MKLLTVAVATYRYRSEPKSGDVAERFGVATRILKRIGDCWKIISMHNSARRTKGS